MERSDQTQENTSTTSASEDLSEDLPLSELSLGLKGDPMPWTELKAISDGLEKWSRVSLIVTEKLSKVSESHLLKLSNLKKQMSILKRSCCTPPWGGRLFEPIQHAVRMSMGTPSCKGNRRFSELMARARSIRPALQLTEECSSDCEETWHMRLAHKMLLEATKQELSTLQGFRNSLTADKSWITATKYVIDCLRQGEQSIPVSSEWEPDECLICDARGLTICTRKWNENDLVTVAKLRETTKRSGDPLANMEEFPVELKARATAVASSIKYILSSFGERQNVDGNTTGESEGTLNSDL